MNTDQSDAYPFLRQERLLLAAALERELPLLGICLGAQQLASVHGGCVFDRPEPAVGWMPISLVGQDLLFEGVPRQFMALEWHAQSFTVPDHACPLALRSGDVGVQAFRAGRRAWGLQFHPEIDAATLEVWLKRDNKGLRRRAPHVLERAARAAGRDRAVVAAAVLATGPQLPPRGRPAGRRLTAAGGGVSPALRPRAEARRGRPSPRRARSRR